MLLTKSEPSANPVNQQNNTTQMEIDDGNGNIDVYSDVDVLTQGTSSLQYPLKNYKIKCYQTNENGERKKLKIIPRPKKDEW